MRAKPPTGPGRSTTCNGRATSSQRPGPATARAGLAFRSLFGRHYRDRAVARIPFALTLDPEPADAAVPMALARDLPTANPVLAEIDANLRFRPRLPSMQRMVCVDPATL